MKRALVVVVMVGGCAPANRAALVASSLAIACDWGQTFSAASDRWSPSSTDRTPRYEANPILGRQPSASVVNAYFFTAITANIVAWLVMPKQIKSAIPVGVLALEYGTVAGNVDRAGVCGL